MMTDVLRRTFLDRLKRFQLMEAALAEQEKFLLEEVPRFFKLFQKKLARTRKGIEELLPILNDDPLNRLFIGLQDAGRPLLRKPSGVPSIDAARKEEMVQDISIYLRVCKALAESRRPMNLEELKPYVPHKYHWRTSSSSLRARYLVALNDAGFIKQHGEGRRPHVRYELTDAGREIVAAIFAN